MEHGTYIGNPLYLQKNGSYSTVLIFPVCKKLYLHAKIISNQNDLFLKGHLRCSNLGQFCKAQFLGAPPPELTQYWNNHSMKSI